MGGPDAKIENQEVVYNSDGLKLIPIPISSTIAQKLKYFTHEDEEDLIYMLKKVNATTNLSAEGLQKLVFKALKMDHRQIEYDKLLESDVTMIMLRRIHECARKAASS